MPTGNLETKTKLANVKQAVNSFPLPKLQTGYSDSAQLFGRYPVVQRQGITTTPRFTGQESAGPAFPPQDNFSPWTGGFPANPVPVIGQVLGKAYQGGTGKNRGLHLGWFKNGKLPPAPVPVNIPGLFRRVPPPQMMGARPPKLGSFHVPADLHASVLPSNPLAYKVINQAQGTLNSTLNDKASARGVYSQGSRAVQKVVGILSGSR